MARRLASQLSQCGTGRKQSGKLSLRRVRVHTRRICQPALSLQRQQHCSASQEERQPAGRRRGRRAGRQTATQTHRGNTVFQSHSAEPQQAEFFPGSSLQMFHNLSFFFFFLLVISCWLHARPPHFYLPHLVTCLHIRLIACSSLPILLPPTASKPSSPLLGLGCVCACMCVQTQAPLAEHSEDQRKVLQCWLRRRVYDIASGPGLGCTAIHKYGGFHSYFSWRELQQKSKNSRYLVSPLHDADFLLRTLLFVCSLLHFINDKMYYLSHWYQLIMPGQLLFQFGKSTILSVNNI